MPSGEQLRRLIAPAICRVFRLSLVDCNRLVPRLVDPNKEQSSFVLGVEGDPGRGLDEGRRTSDLVLLLLEPAVRAFNVLPFDHLLRLESADCVVCARNALILGNENSLVFILVFRKSA